MAKNKDYLIHPVPNQHIMVWDVRKRLTDASIMTFYSKDWKDVRTADERGWAGKVLRFLLGLRKGHEDERREEFRLTSFVDALFEIPGVISVTINQYSFSVHKGELFGWHEIIPWAEKILEGYLAK